MVFSYSKLFILLNFIGNSIPFQLSLSTSNLSRFDILCGFQLISTEMSGDTPFKAFFILILHIN